MEKYKMLTKQSKAIMLSAFLLTACSEDSAKPTTEANSGSEAEMESQTETEAIARSDDRPNVNFIYTDDHGYADLGVQGVVDDVKTPYLDELVSIHKR